MSDESAYIVRVLWDGEILRETNVGCYEHIAGALYDNTVSDYRRSDPVDGGITVQLIVGDDVEYETFID